MQPRDGVGPGSSPQPQARWPCSPWPGTQDAALLIEQSPVDDLRWVVETMAVTLLVRLDAVHIDQSWRHGREKPVEIVEIALLRLHDRSPSARDPVDARRRTLTRSPSGWSPLLRL